MAQIVHYNFKSFFFLLWVLQTEGHDGFSFDGSVVDVDVGNVWEANQRHDVAHAENLTKEISITTFDSNHQRVTRQELKDRG